MCLMSPMVGISVVMLHVVDATSATATRNWRPLYTTLILIGLYHGLR
jgi:hypothetical protein